MDWFKCGSSFFCQLVLLFSSLSSLGSAPSNHPMHTDQGAWLFFIHCPEGMNEHFAEENENIKNRQSSELSSRMHTGLDHFNTLTCETLQQIGDL